VAGGPGVRGTGARTIRSGRVDETRELIMAAAERLFAEQGVVAVSGRQISEAAGQGNNTAVGYHFGSKADLVRAITHKHSVQVDVLREELLARLGPAAEPRDWVACLVAPLPRHLATLAPPSWHARFAAQVVTDPVLRTILAEDALATPSLRRILDGLGPALAGLPAAVRAERFDMARTLIIHTCAERERALAEIHPVPGRTRAAWMHTARSLTDAVTGLLLAPATPARPVRVLRKI
jgi:AcrR family transcriptional regulator